jgi:predicted RNA-binding protein YlxR (DUF448 family)
MLAHAHDSELDRGPKGGARGSDRLCAATRTVKPVDAMVRFVVGPDGAVVPDVRRRLPGRGLWITGSRSVVAEAAKRGAFARGFKSQVKVAPDIADITEKLLEHAALDALAIAGKSGEAVAGFARVEAALKDKNVVAVLHAAEAAADGTGKINAAMRRRFGAERTETAAICCFSCAQLDLALGRSNVVHAALLAGPASNTFLMRCARLMRYRTGNPAEQDHRRTPPGRKPEDRDRNE